jgi:hypothetical protein|tara:strand:+ start:119 stop:586 length:468 start_codon:yes stop_codon:yes gene_type:complete
MADIISYPLGTPAADTLLVGTQMNVQQLDGGEANLTRNFTLSNVASLINTGFAGGYKVYTALLTQAGVVNPPVATIMQNTTGGTIAWTRTGAGAYTATIADSFFTLNKTMVFINGGSATATANIEWASPTTTTVTIDTSFDSLLTGASIEIRVYA